MVIFEELLLPFKYAGRLATYVLQRTLKIVLPM